MTAGMNLSMAVTHQFATSDPALGLQNSSWPIRGSLYHSALRQQTSSSAYKKKKTALRKSVNFRAVSCVPEEFAGKKNVLRETCIKYLLNSFS